MKAYSIGREAGCDITINDSTDVISRRHAILNVMPSGKMTIVDQSSNGTYVNGIRISPNVPVPVTRKDNVSFAHVARLDWNLIPNTNSTIIRWVIIGVVALLFVIGAIWGFCVWRGNSCSGEETPVAIPDSVEMKMEKEKLEQKEKQMQDSIKKHVKDSLEKARQKKVVKPTPKKSMPKVAEPKNKDVKKKKEDNTNKNNKRQRG